ncbi:MAG TPA: antibiotic biosynthesis monooxygenase family protein [Marinagarivorans sp.]
MIYVLIERRIADGMASTYDQCARDMLQQTYAVPGFISGEAYEDMNDHHHRFLLCKWRTLRDWQRWLRSERRAELINLFAPILQEPEKITLLAV